MKTNKIFTLTALLLTGLGVSLATLPVDNKSVETIAATDINDYSACQTAYNNNSGSAMLTALRNITAPGSAGSYAQLWETYKTVYIRDDGKIFDYYSSISNFRPGTDQAGSYSKEGDVYNREHSIPKSWWGGAESNQGADPFIVVPTDGYVNNKRSNYPMGPVGSASYTSSGGFCKLGTVKSGYGYSGTVFEPDDSLKGDFARIVYYAIAKYSGSYGWTSGEGSSTFSGSASTNYGLTNYAIKFYSEWSALDPVSDWERSVNDKLATIQGNRNPFIDHPEYANTLWGSNSNYTEYPVDNKTLTSISLSNKTTSFEVGDTFIKPTVTAHYDDSTTSDVTESTTFSGYNMNSVGNYTVTASYTKGSVTKTATYSISVTASTKTLSSIEVSNPKTSFTVGDTFSFGGTVTATYSNASQSDVTESATFSGYNMSQTGDQTVTVSYTYQGTTKTDTYNINVAAAPSEVTIAVDDIPSTYSSTSFTASGYSFSCSNIGNSYSAGNMQWRSGQGYMYNTSAISNISSIKINSPTTGSFSGTIFVGSSSHPTSGTSYSITGGQTVSINGSPSYFTIQAGSVSGGAKSGSIVIGQTTSQKTLSSIAVATAPTKTTYTTGETFDPTGLVIRRYYSDSTNDTYTYANHTSEFTFNPTTSTALTTENTSVTITYSNKSTTQGITVNAAVKTLSSIAVSTAPTKTTYVVDETFNPTGLVITRNYSDSTSDTYTYADHTSEFSFNPSTSTPLTTQHDSVTITYGGLTCQQAITVSTSGSGGGSTQSGSQRVVSSTSSDNYQAGDVYFTSGGSDSRSASCDAFTMTQTKVSGSTAVPNTYDQIRVYTNHSLMFVPNGGYTIVNILLTAGSTSYASAVGGTSLTNCDKSTSGYTVTLTPIDGTKTLGFQNSSQSQIEYIVVNYEYGGSGSTDPIASISATPKKTFYVGETITSSDITVKDNNNNTLSGFTFSNYQFVYGDATSGGALTSKTFTNGITYEQHQCNLTVQVQRKAYFNPNPSSITLASSAVFNGIGGSNNNLVNGTTDYNDITYEYYQAYYYSGGSVLSFGNASSQNGYMKNQTPFESGITDVTVTSTGRAVNVRYSIDGSNWVLKASADTANNTYKYFKVDCIGKTGSSYSNISSISVTTKGERPENVANYIMYEDTTNQCLSKLSSALDYFKNLTLTDKTTFQTSNDYVISTARQRLESWASSQGKTIDYSTGNLSNKSNILNSFVIKNNESTLFIVLYAATSLSSILALVVIKRRKISI